jgi:hypothetical protein
MIDESEKHFKKHDLPRSSTDDGIVIEIKPLDANDDSSIHRNCEAHSN